MGEAKWIEIRNRELYSNLHLDLERRQVISYQKSGPGAFVRVTVVATTKWALVEALQRTLFGNGNDRTCFVFCSIGNIPSLRAMGFSLGSIASYLSSLLSMTFSNKYIGSSQG